MTDSRTRCKATTKSGTRCRLKAQPGSDYCHVHAEFGAVAADGIQATDNGISEAQSSARVHDTVDGIADEKETAIDTKQTQEPGGTGQTELESPGAASTEVDGESAVADQPAGEEEGPATVDQSAEVADTMESSVQSGTVQENEQPTEKSISQADAAAVEGTAPGVASHETEADAVPLADDDETWPSSDRPELDAQTATSAPPVYETVDTPAGGDPDGPDAGQPDENLDVSVEEHEAQRQEDESDSVQQPAASTLPGVDKGSAPTDDDVEPFEPEPISEPGAADQGAEPAPAAQHDDKGASLIAEVEALAQELCRRLDDVQASASSPAQALELFNRHVGRYAPETQRALFANIQQNLQDASYRDLAEPEVLRGLWYMLYFALRNQSQEVRQRVTTQLSAVPGFEHMADLSQRFKSVPQHSMGSSGRRGLVGTINYQILKALRALRNLISGTV